MSYIGVKFQGFSKKIYHYETDMDFKVGDKAVIIDPSNQFQVVEVTHIDCKGRKEIDYKYIHGKVMLA